MDARDLGHHISQRFDADLEDLRSKVLKTGGVVEQQLDQALRAINDQDSALAEEVIARDQAVNNLELQVDEDCALILARRQPVASDLRLLIAIIKVITDLERMGDEAVRIARMAERLTERAQPTRRPSTVRHLGEHVRGMLRDALDAFARFDMEMAARVVAEDRSVDQEYDSLTRELITFMMEDPRSIPHALDVLFAARALERIGDRACNICEYVIYYVRGKDVRHEGLEALQREAEQSD